MAGSVKCLILLLCFFVLVFSKDLHIKKRSETKDKNAAGFMNLFDDQDPLMKNDRFARHIQAVTESVLDHLLKEIKHQYHNKEYNSNSPIPRLIRNLNIEMKRNERNKLKKEKIKKKIVNKIKHGKKMMKPKSVTAAAPIIM